MSMAGASAVTDQGQSLTEQVNTIANRLEHLCMNIDGVVGRVESPTPQAIVPETAPEPAAVDTLRTVIWRLFPLLDRAEVGVEKLKNLI